ncbi:MAPEG family protein [Altererythrobacter sp. H2]|uniref:MAPEG family protein n=1 Tax=Altererythrobacter sp. H2 TaxID=3108391 RepID=UPI002B4C1C5C|nr:MAPEG family protein [Altererythrobacter sp. H2]WRK94987.1 MAPEG family protein [Altererythrobacter sp. H2]
MQAQMLAPAAILVAWSLIMLFWMAGTRLPAMKAIKADMGDRPGGRGQDLEGRIPDSINWKAHNYSHLMEQPTIFYPTVVIIALLGAGAGDVLAAWIYVGMRIVHSVWQATVNKVPVRFLLFLVSTFALVYLAYRAVALTLFADPGAIPQ